VQILLDRGLGAAGVAIDSAPVKGVFKLPLSSLRSSFPALKNPTNVHKSVALTPEEFHYAFTNTLTEAESQAVWERYAIPAPGRWVWDYGLIANFKPGHQDTWVDFSADRAPLLFIAGEKDHIMPPSVNRSNAKHYHKSPALTDYHEFAGRDHWTCAAPGWEAVADYALEWAVAHADARAAVE
jgi:pimeloyl-ACP methyl ester carboxylesterase